MALCCATDRAAAKDLNSGEELRVISFDEEFTLSDLHYVLTSLVPLSLFSLSLFPLYLLLFVRLYLC
jgi:hypothetical protein